MQRIFITGRVGRDSELRYTQNNKAVLNFSIATDLGWGENKRTVWHNCAVFGERAQKLAEHIQKGKMLLVTGEVTARGWQTNDGEARADLEVFVQDLEFLGGKSESGGQQGGGGDYGGQQNGTPDGGNDFGGGANADLDDEIPF